MRGGFDGGTITTDAGGLLLREVEKRTGIIAQFAACFRDRRKAERIEPQVEKLVAQRVYGLALGYEDLMITKSCGAIRCWGCWPGRRTRQDRAGLAKAIRARRWRARAR